MFQKACLANVPRTYSHDSRPYIFHSVEFSFRTKVREVTHMRRNKWRDIRRLVMPGFWYLCSRRKYPITEYRKLIKYTKKYSRDDGNILSVKVLIFTTGNKNYYLSVVAGNKCNGLKSIEGKREFSTISTIFQRWVSMKFEHPNAVSFRPRSARIKIPFRELLVRYKALIHNTKTVKRERAACARPKGGIEYSRDASGDFLNHDRFRSWNILRWWDNAIFHHRVYPPVRRINFMQIWPRESGTRAPLSATPSRDAFYRRTVFSPA